MGKLKYSGLSFLSGLLLYAAWPVSDFTALIFVAWIPLLYVGRSTDKRLHFFLYSLIAMVSWNALTTWWIWNSTNVGAVAAILANSLLMTLPWWAYHIFKQRYGLNTGHISLVVFWMMFEYLHLNWQLSWPWLTLGNIFALHPGWVQWYSWTGVDGGTLWVLVANIVLFDLIIKIRQKTSGVVRSAIILIGVTVPIAVSYFVQPVVPSKVPKTPGSNVVIVQPNVDPYNEKFDAADVSTQLNTLIALSEQKIDSNTRLVLWPETALSAGVLQSELEDVPVYRPVFDFVRRHPRIMLETGVETFKIYGNVKATKTAHFDKVNKEYFDAFNSAVAIKDGASLQFYNKNKLVPGVETLPDFLLWMGPIFEKFGGTAGGFGRSKDAAVFSEAGNPYVTAPIICYESIYGDYVSSYVRKGANILTIMTNDGWWGNTPGYRQHFEYARLRAIETRRWVARSANTGISGIIDSNGDVIASLPWDEASSIRAVIPVETSDTFYDRFGDWLFKIATFFGLLLIAYHWYFKVKEKVNRQQEKL